MPTASRPNRVPAGGRTGRLPEVIAAFDLSPLGRRVADRARLVAETRGADLRLLHVRERIPPYLVNRPQQRLIRDYEQRMGDDLAAWVRSRSSVDVDLRLARGSVASVICSEGRHAELVVAGSSAIDPSRLGVLARRLARKARTDVLVVRRQPRVPYRRVLAAVDLSEESTAAVNLALRLAPDGIVTVVYAISSQYDALLADSGLFEEELDSVRQKRSAIVADRLREFSSEWDGRVGTLVAEGPPVEAIEEVARRRSADLVTVSSRGADHTSLVLLGGNAEGIMEAAHCDVAVARVEGTFRRR